MKINAELIKSFKPYQDRWGNYLKHYKHQDFTLDQFCKLTRITKQDKLWLLCRLLTQDQVVVFCLDAALRCLSSTANAAADHIYYAACEAADVNAAACDAANAAADHIYYAAYIANPSCDAASDASETSHDESIEILKQILLERTGEL